MKKTVAIVLIGAGIAAIAIGSGYGGYRLAGRSGHQDEASDVAATEDASKPEVRVQVSTVREGSLRHDIVAYGMIIIPSTALRSLSVPFESQVSGVLVAAGETVEEGQPLIEVKPSAATSVSLEESRNTMESTQRDLDLVKQRYEQHFATNTDLNTAQTAANLARGRFQSLQRAGASGTVQVKAVSKGIIAKVDVQPGQLVPIGNPLVEVGPRDQYEAKLGLEPGEADGVKPGMRVVLRDLQQNSTPVTGTIRLVSRDIDPMTRLRNLFVSIPSEARLTMGSAVVGTLGVPRESGLIVPREALITHDTGEFSIFTISDNKAVRHAATIAVETGHFAQISADGVLAGAAVVVIGAEQLEDARAVIATPAAEPKLFESELSLTPPASTTTQPDPVTQPFVSDRGER